MKINSPYFRGALSVAAIWLTAWSYIAFKSYQTEYRNPIDIGFATDPSIYAKCYGEQLDLTSSNWTWRDPTAQERRECEHLAREVYSNQVKDSNEWLRGRSLETVIKLGVLPASALLLLVAFWTELVGISSSIIIKYARWVKYGTNDPNDRDN